MRVEHRLHLGRIDVESRADDQLIGAPDNEKVIAIQAENGKMAKFRLATSAQSAP
jgi:hypothetical protein